MASHSPDLDDKRELSFEEGKTAVPQLNNAHVAKVLEVGNADFAAATADGPRPNGRLLFACFIAFLCACANGYDGSLMTGINAMTSYQDYFKSGTVGTDTSLIFAMYTVGQMTAAWVAGPIADRFGRRMGMFVGGAFIIIGSVLAAAAQNMHMLVGARYVLGFGICLMTTAAPSYAVEISPPHFRGRMTGFYNCGWFGGSIPAAFITFGCQYLHGNIAWRLPLLLQCVPSGIVMAVIFFLPETPRWLMAQGRFEEAHAFLVKYHGNGDSNAPVVKLQVKEFHESISQTGSDKRWWDYSGLFKTKNARWRSLMMIFMGVFGQFSGNGLGYFSTVIYNNLGYTSVTTQLGLNIAGQCISAIGALSAMTLTDKMPRRKILVIGTAIMTVLLALNGGLSTAFGNSIDPKTGVGNLAIGQAAVGMLFIFGFVISFAYTPLQSVYPVECLETASRAKGMAMYAFVVNAISFINLYAGPIALQNIGQNYVYVFVGWDAVETALWYFFGVETSGRTLEELDEIFSADNPVKESKKRAKVAVKDDGNVVVVDQA